MEKQIEKDLMTLIFDHLNVNADETGNLYLLGIMPRDMVKLVYLIEDKYDIQFNESDLSYDKFYNIHNLAVIVNQHIQN